MSHVNENVVAFFSGMFSGGTYGLYLLQVEWQQLVVETPLKILMAVVIAFMSGIAGLAGKDFYNDKIKKKKDVGKTE